MTANVDDLLSVEALRTSFVSHGRVVWPVDGVDLQIREGEIRALVGESGSGKSATALSIMGLISPPGQLDQSSVVTLDGRDLTTLKSEERRHVRGNDIAMIFQEPMTSLNPVYRIGEQIAEALRNHRSINRRMALAQSVDLLQQVRIPEPHRAARMYPHQMSGGMRQRAMIAMAISCGPRLLIADEPTTALDVTIQAQILELLLELRREFGMAILLITHDFGVVAEVADSVSVMYAGRIVEAGPSESLFRDPHHPYTKALLKAMPTLGSGRIKDLYAISGSPPSPTSWPRGCRFAERCDEVFSKCSNYPAMFGTRDHVASCWLREGTDPVSAEAHEGAGEPHG